MWCMYKIRRFMKIKYSEVKIPGRLRYAGDIRPIFILKLFRSERPNVFIALNLI